MFTAFVVALALVSSVDAWFGKSSKNSGVHISTEAYPSEYGVDVTFPIQHYIDPKHQLFRDRYERHMEGCYKFYSKRECVNTEQTRLQMNLDQPQKNHNFTELGFKKTKLPEFAWKKLLEFYEKYKDAAIPEEWPRGYTYVNTWDSPTNMISLENRAFREGIGLKNLIWNAMKPIIEEWTGQKLEPTSMYGIRVYQDKAVLATHVDRLPLVSSCILQVSQEVNEPWPIEVYDHTGRAHNITMQPGDAVLYESHTVLHGRPFPLNGTQYSNLFIHFQPVGYNEFNRKEREGMKIGIPPLPPHKEAGSSNIRKRSEDFVDHEERIEKAGSAALHVGHEQSNHDGRQEEEDEKEDNGEDGVIDQAAQAQDAIIRRMRNEGRNRSGGGGEGAEEEEEEAPFDTGGSAEGVTRDFEHATWALRAAAAEGDADLIDMVLRENRDTNKELIASADENGWTALHEAVRSGELDAVLLLIRSGADVGQQTEGGMTALSIGKEILFKDHPVTKYLEKIGAPIGKAIH